MKAIIAFIIVFGILVFVHEFGHFFFAKRSGILVREFAIGMGPKLFNYRRNGTTYTIRLLPLGGYVRMAGWGEDALDLQPGMPINVVLDQKDQIIKINTSKKVQIPNSIPLEITKFDLSEALFIEGYINGNEADIKHYKVIHDASIIEQDGTEVLIAPKDVQFQSASLPNRMLTNFAGPMNNFILAIVVFTLLAFLQGGAISKSNELGSVLNNSVAENAGLKTGDKIVKVDNKPTKDWAHLTSAIQKQPGKKLTLLVDRNGKKETVYVTPEAKKVDKNTKVGQIGIENKVDRSFKAKILDGFKQTWGYITAIFTLLGSMFTKGFSLDSLGGPVAIYSMTSQTASMGLLALLRFLGFLSVNLGIVNLLPVPALDGGKLVLNIVEGIRRKPMSPEKEGMINMIGFALLMVLMVLVTWNDIQRYLF